MLRMPNKILNHQHQLHHGKQPDGGDAHLSHNHPQLQLQAKNNNSNPSNNNNNNNKGSNNNIPNKSEQQPASILNVAEMILHGVADHEILDIWLRSIACQEFGKNFLDAGYDMPTISRITPQDLTAVGITDPMKRLKILSEIKKLNLQDGIPTFRPASLSHWLSLLRLNNHYHKSLCDQQIDTIEKTCQLTWEDFEELGITKLGHQKRLLLAIERMKELDANEAKQKPMSEPIYDTNPSQILLVASAENHSMNGPIINKQSSTSELSSTGSGSMHSLYSSNSMPYQSSYQTLPSIAQQNQIPHHQNQQHHQQVIYSQPPSQLMHSTQQMNQTPQHHQQNHQNSHYQTAQPQFVDPIYGTNNLNGRNVMMNRQSLGQLPLSALANLPKHQQQLLQQSSIYATLSRQPQRAKQPPPPVPIRTNSLKSNSLVDEVTNNHSSLQSLSNNQNNSTSSLSRSGARVSNRNQFSSQTLLSKNKSFSGGAYMEAARARFLNRNNQLPQFNNLAPQMQHPTNQNNSNNPVNHNLIYGMNSNLIIRDRALANNQPSVDSDNLSIYSRQSIPLGFSSNQANSLNLRSNNQPEPPVVHQNQRHSIQPATNSQNATVINSLVNVDDYDRYSDTNSTKSMILPTTNVNTSPINTIGQGTLSQDSSSSQTLYNSASSGSNDQNLNGFHFSPSQRSTVSSSTLNDVNLILDQHVAQNHNHDPAGKMNTAGSYSCNATSAKDVDFPPPPSPLSLTEFDEQSLNNFTDVSQGLMTFRVGT